jgi:hypothetical protein
MVATAEDGSIYLFSQVDSRLTAYDSTGRRRWSRGREGAGPGEFGLTWTIVATPDGGVEVFDLGNMRRSRFDAQGSLLGSSPLTSPPFRSRAVYHGSGLAVALPWSWGQRLVFIVGTDTATIAQHDLPESRFLTFPECGVSLGFPRLFTTWDVRWGGSRDLIAVNLRPQYQVDVYHGQRLAMVILRDLAPRKPSAAAMAAWYPNGFVARRQGTECRIPAERAAARLGSASLVPVIRDLIVSPAGEIWVVRDPVAPGQSALDVIAPDGRYLGTLPAATPVPITFTDRGDPVALEMNELGLQRLTVYRLVRGE